MAFTQSGSSPGAIASSTDSDSSDENADLLSSKAPVAGPQPAARKKSGISVSEPLAGEGGVWFSRGGVSLREPLNQSGCSSIAVEPSREMARRVSQSGCRSTG